MKSIQSVFCLAFSAFITLHTFHVSAQCSGTTISSEGFESGWGIWVDGGADAQLATGTANTGSGSADIQDAGAQANITTGDLDLSSYSDITIIFAAQPSAMSAGEGFFLQMSSNGGSSFTTIQTYTVGTNVTDGVWNYDTVSVSGPFTTTMQIRFECNGGNNGDDVYLDDIAICGPFVNAPPSATDDAASTPNDDITIDVLANDTEPNGDDMTINAIISSPDNGGSATINNNGTPGDPTDDYIDYSPEGTYFGVETFTYEVCDDQAPALCDTATVSVTVSENTAPAANNDTDNTPADQAIAIDVLANDSDADGHNITLSSITVAPDNGGSAVINDNSTPGDPSDDYVDYTPSGSYEGDEVFTYQICDDGNPSKCSTATVTVTIPVNNAPSAAADAASTPNDDITIDVLSNDTDADGDNITITSITVVPDNGGSAVINDNGTPGNPADDYIDYSPDGAYFGAETFTYQICDDGAPQKCATAVVTVTVSANTTPVAGADWDTTTATNPLVLDVLANDSDADGHNLTLTGITVAPSQSGSAVINNNSTPGDPSDDFIDYTPDGGYDGWETFTYQVCDDGNPNECTTAVVSVWIQPNGAPVADGDAPTTPNDDITIDVLANDSDPNGDNITLDSIISGPSNGGTATINDNGTPGNPADDYIDYSPSDVYYGVETFIYRICDDGSPQKCDTAVVSVTVTPNNAPTAVADNAGPVADTQSVAIDVLANDSDADGHTLTLDTVSVAPNYGGTATVNDNGTPGNPADDYIDFTPSGAYSGVVETFTYKVCDDGNPSQCGSAVVSVYIAPADTFTWNGNVDGVSVFNEGNWSNGVIDIPLIDAGVELDYNLVINSGNPGGGGFTGNLVLGGNNLRVTGGLLKSGSGGITSVTGTSTIDMTGGAIWSTFIVDQTVTLAGDAELTLNGGGNPVNNSTIDFDIDHTGFLYFTNETVADFTAEHLSKCTVNGEAGVIDLNLAVVDSSGGAKVYVAVAEVPVDTFYWTGNSDGESVFDEGNWENGAYTIPYIAPNFDMQFHLVVDSGTPGGAAGFTGHLQLGTKSLTINGGTMLANSTYGIKSNSAGDTTSTIYINGGSLECQFLSDQEVYMQNDATLILNGGNNPVNGSTIDLSSCDSMTIYFTDEVVAAVRAEHLSKITVNGNPAVENQNVFLQSDSISGTYLYTLTIGMACNDGDTCTVNDSISVDCECTGTLLTDSDGDGVCDLNDVCPGYDDLLDNNFNGIPDSCDDYCIAGTIDSFAYVMSFENGTVENWTQSTVDSIDWIVISGPTPSSGTGPSAALDGSYYLYVEASDNFPNKTAEIISPCFDLTSAPTPSLEFYYHLFGSPGMGSITAYASTEQDQEWVQIFQVSDNQGDQWFMTAISLTDYVGDYVRIKFIAETGLSWKGDLAIDSIAIVLDCTEGDPCDDGDECTTNDMYDADCNCVGEPSSDSDGDGICDAIDPVPGYADIYISSGATNLIQLYKLDNDLNLDPVGDPEVVNGYNSIAFNMVDGYIYGVELENSPPHTDMVRLTTNGVVEPLGKPTWEGSEISTNLWVTGAMDFNDKFYAYSHNAGPDLGTDPDEKIIMRIDVVTMEIDTFWNFGDFTSSNLSDIAFNFFDRKIYGVDIDGMIYIFDLENSTVETHTVDNYSGTQPVGGAWFDAYGSFYILENSGQIYRVDSIDTEARYAGERRADHTSGGTNARASNWRATLAGTTTPTSQNDATNGITPAVTNAIYPPLSCGTQTATMTYAIFNPFTTEITLDFTDDLRTVDDYADDTVDQSATPLDATFLPGTLSGTYGGSAAFSASDQEITISNMTIPALSTVFFDIQVNTPDLDSNTIYYSQSRIHSLSSPVYAISSRVNILSTDISDAFRGNPTGYPTNCGLLPVELINLTVNELNGNALLQWETASEVNNDYFIIERSANAAQWVEIAHVDGNGNTDYTSYYSYEDATVKPGITYYYRLRQVDFDASYEYSPIRHITISGSPVFGRWDVYPVPASVRQNMLIEASECDNCRVRMYDTSGSLILDRFMSNGAMSVDLRNMGLTPGVYIVEMSDRTYYERKKIILQ